MYTTNGTKDPWVVAKYFFFTAHARLVLINDGVRTG